MMNPINDPSNPAAQPTPARNTDSKAIIEAIIDGTASSESTPASQRVGEQRHFPPPHLLLACKRSTPGSVVGGTDGERGSVLSEPEEFKPQALYEREDEAKWEPQHFTEHLQDISYLKQRDLRPCAFTSLSDAFRASLCVIRCLRSIIGLHFGYADTWGAEKQSSSSGPLHGLQAESSSVAAHVLSHQESFVADAAAYDHLLNQSNRCPQDPSHAHAHAPAESVSADASATPQKGFSSPELRGVAACPFKGERTAMPSSCREPPGGGMQKSLRESPVAPGTFASTSAQTRGSVEYELSVCKALLLLQHLTPNTTTAVEESPSTPSPQSVPPLNIAGRAPVYSAYSTTKKASNSTDISDSSCSGFQAAILEILLRVRILQGTQQLKRRGIPFWGACRSCRHLLAASEAKRNQHGPRGPLKADVPVARESGENSSSSLT